MLIIGQQLYVLRVVVQRLALDKKTTDILRVVSVMFSSSGPRVLSCEEGGETASTGPRDLDSMYKGKNRCSALSQHHKSFRTLVVELSCKTN